MSLLQTSIVQKSLILRVPRIIVRDFVYMIKIHRDHLYMCRQKQAIPEDSTVSSDVSLPSGTTSTECQTDLTTDEIEYLITELEECKMKIMIHDGKVENKKRLKTELNTEDLLRDDESVKFFTGLPIVFASTATVSSSCSTKLSCDINFVSSASVIRLQL